jgi:CBS domain-containing protein
MTIAEICNRGVVRATAGTSVRDAARLMRDQHVGSVVVVEDRGGREVPVGIVTDRDITVAVVALSLDPAVIEIGDVMAPRFVSVGTDWNIAEVLELMEMKGVRRMVVTAGDDSLYGIVTSDDFVSALASDLIRLSRVPATGREREQKQRRAVR